MTTFLPLLSDAATPRHGSRSLMTCAYRCGNACDQPVPNPTDHPEFANVARRAFARRSLLKASAAGPALSWSAPPWPSPRPPPAPVAPPRPGRHHPEPDPVHLGGSQQGRRRHRPRGLPQRRPHPVGRPRQPGTPRAFDVDAQTPEKAEGPVRLQQRLRRACCPLRGDSFLLVCNHEYTDEALMFPTGAYDDEEVKRIAMASHGMSVVKIERGRRTGSYRVSRPRPTPTTSGCTSTSMFKLDGPAAGDERGCGRRADPSGRRVRGTLNNCSGGLTPWGTVLSGEENFNQYFEAGPARSPREYADVVRPLRHGGHQRAQVEHRRPPLRPGPGAARAVPVRLGRRGRPVRPQTSVPRKHTMLGRLKHEGANIVIAASGQRRRLHRRRRARRLPLQVRLRREVRPAAHRPG